jgi:hypothetical protein
MVSIELVAATNPAVYGLLGSLIGGFIAGTVSLLVAWQTRGAAERAWVRDNRRELYDRFLTNAQRLLIALEDALDHGSESELRGGFIEFFSAYGVVQTVADRPVVDAARTTAYRLLELKNELDAGNPSGRVYFKQVAEHVRRSRHDVIDAMRLELGRTDSARPPKSYDPFLGTDIEREYHEAVARRRATAARSS